MWFAGSGQPQQAVQGVARAISLPRATSAALCIQNSPPDPNAQKDALIASLRAQAEESQALIEELRNQLAEQQRLVAALRDEIARLKGGPGRPNIKPNIKPSGMERGTERKSPKDKKPPRGSTRSKVTIDEERIVKVEAPPSGSRFKGYTSYVVQDLVIRTQVVNFRFERWEHPLGAIQAAGR